MDGQESAFLKLWDETNYYDTGYGMKRIKEIEHARTGSGDDVIHGSHAGNEIFAGAGNDIIKTLGGNDLIHFESSHGDDVIRDFDVDHDKLFLHGLDRFDAVATDSGILINTYKGNENAGSIHLDQIEMEDNYPVNFLGLIRQEP